MNESLIYSQQELFTTSEHSSRPPFLKDFIPGTSSSCSIWNPAQKQPPPQKKRPTSSILSFSCRSQYELRTQSLHLNKKFLSHLWQKPMHLPKCLIFFRNRSKCSEGGVKTETKCSSNQSITKSITFCHVLIFFSNLCAAIWLRHNRFIY